MATRYTYIGNERFPLPEAEQPAITVKAEEVKPRRARRPKMEEPSASKNDEAPTDGATDTSSSADAE